MSKEIELNIVISKDGKVTITPKGTQGKEGLNKHGLLAQE